MEPISTNSINSSNSNKFLGEIIMEPVLSKPNKILDSTTLPSGKNEKITKNTQSTKKCKEAFKRAYEKALHLYKGSFTQKMQPLLSYHCEYFDPQHRYGKFMVLVFNTWKNSTSTDSYVDWLSKLDNGENVPGKEDLRKLHLVGEDNRLISFTHVLYLSEDQRKNYEMEVDAQGRVFSKQNKNAHFHTTGTSKDDSCIFVIDANDKVYITPFNRGVIAHSSLLSGGAVKSAGVLFIDHGKITGIWNDSGHYNNDAPKDSRDRMMQNVVRIFQSRGINLTDVELSFTEVKGSDKVIMACSALEFIKTPNLEKTFKSTIPKTSSAKDLLQKRALSSDKNSPELFNQ